MVSRVDHVSLAVRDIDAALRFFADLLGAVPGALGKDPGMKYYWQILSLGDLSRIELITPTGEGSFLDNFLRDKKGGVHHITLQTPDIQRTKEALEGHNIPFFGFAEYADIWKEIFIHPKHAFGVLVQLAEFNADDWISPSLRMPKDTKWTVKKDDDGVQLTFAHPGGGTASIVLNKEDALRLLDALKEALKIRP